MVAGQALQWNVLRLAFSLIRFIFHFLFVYVRESMRMRGGARVHRRGGSRACVECQSVKTSKHLCSQAGDNGKQQ